MSTQAKPLCAFCGVTTLPEGGMRHAKDGNGSCVGYSRRSKRGRKPKNGVEAATERIQVRVTKATKRLVKEHDVDLGPIVEGIVRGIFTSAA